MRRRWRVVEESCDGGGTSEQTGSGFSDTSFFLGDIVGILDTIQTYETNIKARLGCGSEHFGAMMASTSRVTPESDVARQV
ncbi:hypothetical protein VNO77_43806 [Canavalia gladiata]|uniref:Uncharacterized protein n=1 Tax=Canavalia gladiata TaxID=3824 RepID=A0AAN9JX21_CANGL